MMTNIKITAFWDVIPHSLIDANVPKEPADFQGTRFFCCEEG